MFSDWLPGTQQAVHVDHQDAVAGVTADFPDWLPEIICDSLRSQGIHVLWQHQRVAADAIFAGSHTVISTGTGSGKSLCYLLPILAATAAGPHCQVSEKVGGAKLADDVRTKLLGASRAHTALYLAPTKALAHDQLRAATALAPNSWCACALDGDSSAAERDFAQRQANFWVTNPDMLHYSLLPKHERFASFWRGLRYVVIDEMHHYRGVFGAHVASVLRRLRRICAHYGSHPVFVCVSATAASPAATMQKLVGMAPDCEILEDFAPHGERTTILWQPDENMHFDVAQILANLVDEGKQTLAFIASRVMSERVAMQASAQLSSTRHIKAYRGGYFAQDRRKLEADLHAGLLHGVATTNALELGVDIPGVDAVIIAGFPGTYTAFRQQSGRAGRCGQAATVVLVAKPDPLDAYLFAHPNQLLQANLEPTVLHPQNPNVLVGQLCAAAQELPLQPSDSEFFGSNFEALADKLSEAKVLRKRGACWFWQSLESAASKVNLRSASGKPVDIVDSATGAVLGQMDVAAADRSLYPGAIYLHQGESWQVEQLNFRDFMAFVRQANPTYYTQAQSADSITILREHERVPQGAGWACWGEVELTSQVTSYLRRDNFSGQVWDQTALDLPKRRFVTQAMWWLIPDAVVDFMQQEFVRLHGVGMHSGQVGSAAHAWEHTAIGLLPAFVPCDRWDIGGLSTALHPDTGMCTIFVHDGHAGGAGFSAAGFDYREQWLTATLQRLTECSCSQGCPSCCISPKCGNANQHLDKNAARVLLEAFCGLQ